MSILQLKAMTKKLSLPTDETNYNINNVTLSISDLAGPCTITAYAKLNGDIIGSNKAKLFGSNPSPLKSGLWHYPGGSPAIGLQQVKIRDGYQRV